MDVATASHWDPLRLEPRGARPAAPTGAPDLSIVVPTFNERDNVAELVRRLRACLPNASWEVIFVDDDSPDGTADVVRGLAAEDSRVRCIQRFGRRGLTSACVEGMLSSSADYLAVIDGDLQHDERLLPRMLDTLMSGDTDIVIGSRYSAGGDVGNFDRQRARISRLATRISRALVPAELSDPMSGFFMMRREVFTQARPRLSNLGFKILTDLFASSPRQPRFRELSYSFGARHAGESKFDSASVWDYVMLVLDKLVGRWVPMRFLAFSIVGTLGMGVHFAVLTVLLVLFGSPFLRSQAIAIVAAMTFNFALNNLLTYRDRRLHGVRWVGGWLTFMLACGVGALINLGLADSLYRADHAWPFAALCGILVGAVWNYVATTFITWGRTRS